MLTGATDATIAKGWETLEEEVVLDEVAVEGRPPPWLQGTLLRYGPARFDRGQCHWFDEPLADVDVELRPIDNALDEVARERPPHHVPFGFHGQFYEV